jgi:hypothetical protein
MFQEICDDPKYVTGGASRFDVQQGELGMYIAHHLSFIT